MSEHDRWERDALREIALEGIKERRRTRRWGIFFKLAFLLYLVALLGISTGGFDFSRDRPVSDHLARVDVTGMISASDRASADTVSEGLRAAFEAPGAQGVVLYINSPGGSPVQANRIFVEIERLREKHPDTPVYAVIDDLGASGAYYIAAAADEIFVNPSSQVGSIGVIAGGFGFTEAIDKLGIERRVYAAGDNKAFLDPFSPEDETHIAHLDEMLEEVHQQFIEAVRSGRGDRLVEEEELFSGLIWSGERSVELGLADGFGDVAYVAREVVGVDDVRDYTRQPDLLRALADRLGTRIGQAMAEVLGGDRELR